jgi:hypothetical protein
MMRFIVAAFALAFVSPAMALSVATFDSPDRTVISDVYNDALYDPSTFAPSRLVPMLAADATTSTTTNTDTPTEPSKVTTIVQGGTWAAAVLDWFKVAMVPVVGTMLVAAFLKLMAYAGIQTTVHQSSQLQNIAINGLNNAMDRAEVSVRTNPNLSFEVKNQIVADAIAYTQDHAKETITAMGMDPQSGKAVEAIRAKILTVINDPTKPTPPAITPKSAGGIAS